jgi:hypothetical protein
MLFRVMVGFNKIGSLDDARAARRQPDRLEQ